MNKGNFPLFSSWLKQFITTVFLQSFHAILLMFSMIMLSNVQSPPAGTIGSEVDFNTVKIDGVLAVVAIACAMALIKLEKMIKKLFGIEDSPVGHTAAAGAKLFMGAKSAMGLGTTAVSGFKKSRDASKNLKDIQSKKAKKQDAYDRIYNPEAYNAKYPHKAEQLMQSLQSPNGPNTPNGTQDGKNQGATDNDNNNNNNNRNNDKNDFQRILDRERREDELEDLEEQENKARKAKKSAGIDKYLNLAGTLASVSVGLGAADELSESLTVSNVINQPLDWATDKFSNKVAGKQVYKEVKERYIKENNEIRAENKRTRSR
jgi:hypothetical protein